VRIGPESINVHVFHLICTHVGYANELVTLITALQNCFIQFTPAEVLYLFAHAKQGESIAVLINCINNYLIPKFRGDHNAEADYLLGLFKTQTLIEQRRNDLPLHAVEVKFHHVLVLLALTNYVDDINVLSATFAALTSNRFIVATEINHVLSNPKRAFQNGMQLLPFYNPFRPLDGHISDVLTIHDFNTISRAMCCLRILRLAQIKPFKIMDINLLFIIAAMSQSGRIPLDVALDRAKEVYKFEYKDDNNIGLLTKKPPQLEDNNSDTYVNVYDMTEIDLSKASEAPSIPFR
jgi:hypothetical protein